MLIPTARAGIDIVGLDGSPAMLPAANRASQPNHQPFKNTYRADLGRHVAFDVGRRFPLITMPFRPFLHLLTVDDQLACLTAVHDHLEERGRLILDVFNPSFETWANETSPRSA